MKSTKLIWGTRAKRVKVTRSGTLTKEDAKATVKSTGQRVLGPKARQVVKKMLKKKQRQMDWSSVKGFE